MPTKVLLADFQYLTRQGISSLIDAIPNFQVIHQVYDSARLEESILVYRPDIVVLDVSDKDNLLIDLIRRIKKLSNVNFLIVSNSPNNISIQQLLDMGIKGIVTKNCSEQEITQALQAVSQNNKFFCNTIRNTVVTAMDKSNSCTPIQLTEREYEVLTLIAKGNTSAQMANLLFVSVHTINSHRKNILKKLKMKSPTELIVYAIQSGMINIS